eukprot:comp15684_c0_seq1/m.12841 comp15684_c0_seq1/g.12841  ORF comp15684_c0_seq1/g.12841 comp15684_c0_seq1/m.12841 type:complete len:290 (-) comp15684_c0_seq1:557-1426(-)
MASKCGKVNGASAQNYHPNAYPTYPMYNTAPPAYDPLANMHDDLPDGHAEARPRNTPVYSIRHRGTSNASVEVHLSQGQSIKSESDALYAMQGDVTIGSSVTGGVFGMLKRWVTSESTFHQTLTANSGHDNVVLLAPDVLGDVEVMYLQEGESLCMAKGAFLACDDSVTLDVALQSFSQSFFSGAGVFVITATGPGHIVFNGYGGIDTLECTPNRPVTVDNGHLVAWESGLTYNVQTASTTLWSSVTSGEGLMCRFSGSGKIYVQTRKEPPPIPQQNTQSCNCPKNGSM